MNEYALYKGDDLLYIGTAREISEAHGVQLKTVYYYQTPAYKRKIAKRKNARNYITIIRLDDDE